MKLAAKIASKALAFSFVLIASGASMASSEGAIAAAERARQAASEVGYEWRDTGKMIEQAKELAAKGKDEEAISLAQQAEQQGIAAFNQHRGELNRYSKNH